MFNLFTKPEGEETTKGKIISIIVGLLVGTGFYALSNFVSSNASEGLGFSSTASMLLAVFFTVITTYEMRKRLAKKIDADDINE